MDDKVSGPVKDPNPIINMIINLEEAAVLQQVRVQLSAGESPKAILDALNDGMTIIGEKYAVKEFFLVELVMSAEIFKGAMELLEPALQGGEEGGRETIGTIVIGTVKGDLHDIGKNIFVALALNAGFQVLDLGIDVPPEAFVDRVRKGGVDIVGLSGLLTQAIPPMGETVEVLRAAGLRDQVKVIIGGISVDDQWCKQVGADAFTDDAYEGLHLAKQFVGAA